MEDAKILMTNEDGWEISSNEALNHHSSIEDDLITSR